jgi:outer membrane protein
MTQSFKTLKVWVHLLAISSLAVTASAQTAGPAATPQAAQDRYVPGQAKPPAVAGQVVINLTLDEAIQRALDRNLDLKVQSYNPQLTDYSIQATQAAYRPSLTSQTTYSDNTQLTQLQTDGSTPSFATRTARSNTTFNQPTRYRGLSFSGNFTTSRTFSTQTTSLRPVGFSSSYGITASQPLLRNFRIDNTRTSLKTQQITREINDIQLKTAIANKIAQVRAAYWDLRSAIENIEIQRRALALATKLVEDNRTKVEIGTLAQIDIIQAESQQANAELALVNAESAWRTADLAFKALIAGGTEDDIFKGTINPVDVPSVAPTTVDLSGAITSALSQRTDLVQARKNIESALLTIELQKNQVLPDLNLTGGYSVSGAGGNQFNNDGTIKLASDYFDSITGAVKQPSWNLAANFTYPIGQVAARANLARTRLSLEQTKTSLKNSELGVTTEVSNAALNVQNTYKALLASQKARELSERQSEAEQTRFEVGMATNFTVVQLQQSLTSARLAELRAMLNYIKAQIEFERVQSVGR